MPDRGPICRVSVLMPVYNGGRFLRPAVESILAQSCRDFELIAIDDGSSDGSGELLDEMAGRDARVRIFHQANQGLVPTLNRALQVAQAPLVARMDADDIAEPARLERQTRYLAENPDVAAVGSAITLIDDRGQELRVRRYPETPDAIRSHLEKDAALAHPAVMMRRDCVLSAGGYRAAFRHVEDYDLWLRLSEKHDLANLAEPLLRYRVHDSKVSTQHAAEQIVGRRMAQFSALRRRSGYADPFDNAALSMDECLRSGPAMPFGRAAACDLMLAYVRTNDAKFRDKLQAVLGALSHSGSWRAQACRRLLQRLPRSAPVRKATMAAILSLLLRPKALPDLLRILVTRVRQVPA